MILFSGKPINQWSKSDLEYLVSEKYCEGDSLDFKAIVKFDDPVGNGIRDFLKDIVSFANHRGGYIIIGIGELKEKKDQAGEVVPVSDCEKLAKRCRDLCNEHIDPRLWGLEIQSIQYNGTDGAVVIKIPRSFHAPHMVKFKDLYQFWIRGGRENRLMSVEEIKYACRVTQNIFQDITVFLEERKKAFQGELPKEPVIRATATPLLVAEDVIDIHDEEIRKTLAHPSGYIEGSYMVRCPEIRPSLYGLHGGNSKYENFEGVFSLFRNGHFENVRGLSCVSQIRETQDSKLKIEPSALTEHVVSFFRLYWQICNIVQIATPIVVSLEFYNINGILLPKESFSIFKRLAMREDRVFEDKDNSIFIPPRQVYLSQSPDAVARDLCDILWNAVGFERAPYFSDDGKWTGGDKV